MSSLIQLRPRLAGSGNAVAQYDQATTETVLRFTAVTFEDDFIGPGHASIPTEGSPTTGYPWVKRLVKTAGSPSVAQVANASGGVIQLAIDDTSEGQEATFYQNDNLGYDGSKSAAFECRLAMSVLPTTGVEVVFGLQSAWESGPDNAAEYIEFQLEASGAVNCRVLDGVTSAQTFASGVTLVASAYHNFRFDASVPTNIQFWIDGVKVSPTPPTAFLTFAATGASAVLQPYFSVYKASGTGVGTMLVDMVECGMNRS